jgi:uncharacterized membrane protein
MKRDLQLDILALLAATALLIVVIALIPSDAARVVLALPFLLFFPGYVLVAALFPRRTDLDGIKRVALSFLLSIAVDALIGLVLNYTSWGIKVYPILISISIFILIASVIAWYRRSTYLPAERFKVELHPRMPALFKADNTFDRVLIIVLILAILGAAGTLVYTVAKPKVGERFTEFYLLGINGEADGYPKLFTYNRGRVTSVTYEEGGSDVVVSEPYARIVLGIANREHHEETYRVEVLCNGQRLSLKSGYATVDELGPIVLQHGEKWEQEIGFAPSGLGDGQRIEFLLYMNDRLYFEEGQAPHLWVDVRGATSLLLPP